MKKKILVASFDLAIGGVERSLIGLLNQMDYEKYEVDLMLFKHEGEFLPFIPDWPKRIAGNSSLHNLSKVYSANCKRRFIPHCNDKNDGKVYGIYFMESSIKWMNLAIYRFNMAGN